MGPDKHKNSGARFERLLDSLHWSDDPHFQTEEQEEETQEQDEED